MEYQSFSFIFKSNCVSPGMRIDYATYRVRDQSFIRAAIQQLSRWSINYCSDSEPFEGF